jgi:molecular chaperone GrpE
MSDAESIPVDPSQEDISPQDEAEADAAPQVDGDGSGAPSDEETQEDKQEATSEQAPEAEEGNELEALQAELEQSQAQAAEYLDGWQRARAEFANYKKRTESEREELRRSSTEGLLLKLLPVVDDIERAFQTLPEDSADESWVEGFRMIQRKLQSVLESQDITPIEAVGQPFDPLWHEAVMQEETDAYPDGYVAEEMQRGYRLGDRVLRPSMVKVASNPNETDSESENG